jgi:hypothetical protein
MNHDIPHEEAEQKLSANVRFGWDGLKIEV